MFGEIVPQPARVELSSERIVTETLRLIDEQGIAAASMRTVAQRLNVRAMSLYRHIENREQLSDAVVERIVSELDHDAQIPESAADVGWRAYLAGLAWGVRRYGRAHPHAFPLVAMRPRAAPWISPPLRSLRWIEALLANLAEAGFTDDHILFTYRSFNNFLLGYLLLETSAMVIASPKPGGCSHQVGDDTMAPDALSTVVWPEFPIRSGEGRHTVIVTQLYTDIAGVADDQYPTVHRLRASLAEDRFDSEFALGLDVLIERIGRNRAK